MNKRSKILMTLAGVGIMGMLTGCGAEAPLAEAVPVAPLAPEIITNPEVPQDASSGNLIVNADSVSVSENATQNANGNTSGQSNNNSTVQTPSGKVPSGVASAENFIPPDTNSEPNDGTEVIALADSEEQAQQIAELYGITLKSYSLGVAVYTTDKDITALIQMGKENNYPELALNHQVQLY